MDHKQYLLNWIKGSKVVTPAGEPLRVYHGTQRIFKQFECPSCFGKVRFATDGGFEMSLGGKSALYFTSSPDAASTYANLKRGGRGGNVHPVFLRITHPYVIDAGGKYWTGRVADEYKLALRFPHYDGVIVRNVIDCATTDKIVSDVYVVREPSQIKSAIGYGIHS
jgi:hypothetical protein